MKHSFDYYLDKTGEIGVVDQVFGSLVFVTGLPSARPGEVVVFASGETGQVLGLTEVMVHVLVFASAPLSIGTKVAKTEQVLAFPVGQALLGKILTPLGSFLDGGRQVESTSEYPVYAQPPELSSRRPVVEPYLTGVAVVDLVVPLGKGQRQLVIGDRKIGKTHFLYQAMRAHASRGGVVVYAGIARRHLELKQLLSFATAHGFFGRLVILVSLASDMSGLIYLTPYSAMAVAEYFRDQGQDVLIVFDDMTAHAKYYREIALLARHFPGRSSYPGDIFYQQARLLERAGNFTKGSITALSVAETILSDISGYIQTNLMAMTDGHLFFDRELFNQGRRPAVNPFLSVTRVGKQTHPPPIQDFNRVLTRFMLEHSKLKQLVHFGGEMTDAARKHILLGDRLFFIFDQSPETIVAFPLAVLLVTMLLSEVWLAVDQAKMRADLELLFTSYQGDATFRKRVDEIIGDSKTFVDLKEAVLRYQAELLPGSDVDTS